MQTKSNNSISCFQYIKRYLNFKFKNCQFICLESEFWIYFLISYLSIFWQINVQ